MWLETEKLANTAGHSIHVIKISGESKFFTLSGAYGEGEVQKDRLIGFNDQYWKKKYLLRIYFRSLYGCVQQGWIIFNFLISRKVFNSFF